MTFVDNLGRERGGEEEGQAGFWIPGTQCAVARDRLSKTCRELERREVTCRQRGSGLRAGFPGQNARKEYRALGTSSLGGRVSHPGGLNGASKSSEVR